MKYAAKIFNTKSNFTRHVSMHKDAGKEHNCSTCQKSFVNGRGLKNHQKTVHSVPEKLDLPEKTDHTQSSLCSVCGKRVANIKRHLGTHSEDHFKCNTCDKLFSTGRNLSDHKSDVHNQIKEKYHCKECSKVGKNLFDIFMRTDWLQVKKYLRQNKCPM